MDAVVMAFGAALVSAMATDTWEQARTSVVDLWRRLRPLRQVEVVDGELDVLRERVLSAREQRRADVEQALVGVWQARLQELLLDDPAVAGELRRILEHTLLPMMSTAERARSGQITMTGSSHDNSTFNQFIGDQSNTRP